MSHYLQHYDLFWLKAKRTENWFPNKVITEEKNKTDSNTCPIIWKVFVHNLSHLCLVRVKDGRFEVKDHVQHGGLSRQGRAAVLGQRVCRDLRSTQPPKEAAVGDI